MIRPGDISHSESAWLHKVNIWNTHREHTHTPKTQQKSKQVFTVRGEARRERVSVFLKQSSKNQATPPSQRALTFGSHANGGWHLPGFSSVAVLCVRLEVNTHTKTLLSIIEKHQQVLSLIWPIKKLHWHTFKTFW